MFSSVSRETRAGSKVDLNSFIMASATFGHLVIGRVGGLAAGIAGYGPDHAGNRFKIGFNTPETPSGDGQRFGALQLVRAGRAGASRQE